MFRFDRGQEASDPPLRDVMVTGNVISNPDLDELTGPAAKGAEGPRYHYAVRIETEGTMPARPALQRQSVPGGRRRASPIKNCAVAGPARARVKGEVLAAGGIFLAEPCYATDVPFVEPALRTPSHHTAGIAIPAAW